MQSLGVYPFAHKLYRHQSAGLHAVGSLLGGSRGLYLCLMSFVFNLSPYKCLLTESLSWALFCPLGARFMICLVEFTPKFASRVWTLPYRIHTLCSQRFDFNWIECSVISFFIQTKWILMDTSLLNY